MRDIFFVRLVATTLCATALLMAAAAYASHPLGTEVPETVTPLAVAAEVTYELSHYGGYGAGDEGTAGLWIGTGIVKGFDIGVYAPYLTINPEEGDNEAGFGDVEAAVKWNFLEESTARPALALKASVTFPTGDEKKWLGSGGYDVSTTILAGKNFGPLGIYLNLGYTRIDKTKTAQQEVMPGDESEKRNRDLYAGSLAGKWNVIEQLALVGEVLYESAAAKGDDPAVSATIGAIWQVTDNVGIDVGGRFGITDAAPDWTFLAGLNFAFGEAESEIGAE